MDASMNISEEIAEIPYDGKGIIEIINDTKSQVKLLKNKQKIIVFISYAPQIKVVTDNKSTDITVETPELKCAITKTTPSIEELTEELNNYTFVSDDLPTEQQLINYISSKPGFEYHTIELQEKFLGKRLKYRENPALYGAFDRVINKAVKQIAKMNNSKWEHFKTISLGGRTHVYVYRLVKANETEVKNINDSSVTPIPEEMFVTQ